MKNIIAIAGLVFVMSVMLSSSSMPVLAEDLGNVTWSIGDGKCVFELNSTKTIDNINVFESEDKCIGVLNENTRRLKVAQDCPAPPKNGCIRVTYMPNQPVKNKIYMYACRGEFDIKDTLGNSKDKYQFVSIRGTNWKFIKYKYIG